MKIILYLSLFFYVSTSFAQQLTVRPGSTIIEKNDGRPFLWLGDTAWELFHVLNKEEIINYLDNRKEKGFTVIQAVILSEMDGLNRPNAYGHLPLIDNDPTRPTPAYFDLVDFVVNETGKRGMYVGLLPTWANNVVEKEGKEALFNTENAYVYGKILGERYMDSSVIWILGGDRNVVTQKEYEIWQSMARGITAGNGGKQLMSYHPTGEISSHYWFHNEDWLSFNIIQSGHYRNPDPVYRFAGMYAQVYPLKPFVNAEPSYEDIPVCFWHYFDFEANGRKKEDVINERGLIKDTTYFKQGIYNDHDIRMQAYWTYFSGAAGYTYGNNAVWQMYKPGGRYNIPCLTFWDEALDRPGAQSMLHLSNLLTKYPLGSFHPDLSVLFGINYYDSSYITPVVANDHSYILVYLSIGQEAKIWMNKLHSPGIAKWYNPATGEEIISGRVINDGIKSFTPPKKPRPGYNGNDWVLVIDTKTDR